MPTSISASSTDATPMVLWGEEGFYPVPHQGHTPYFKIFLIIIFKQPGWGTRGSKYLLYVKLLLVS